MITNCFSSLNTEPVLYLWNICFNACQLCTWKQKHKRVKQNNIVKRKRLCVVHACRERELGVWQLVIWGRVCSVYPVVQWAILISSTLNAGHELHQLLQVTCMAGSCSVIIIPTIDHSSLARVKTELYCCIYPWGAHCTCSNSIAGNSSPRLAAHQLSYQPSKYPLHTILKVGVHFRWQTFHYTKTVTEGHNMWLKGRI